MNTNKEIDHEFTEQIVCPECGYKMLDSWEFDDGDEQICPECGCKFKITIDISIEYSTKRI